MLDNLNLTVVDSIWEKLKKVGDLLYYDGPLISLMQDIVTHDSYIAIWFDYDSNYNRWLFFQVSYKSLTRFVNTELNMLELVVLSDNLYLVDIGGKDNAENYWYNINLFSEIPEKYLPEEGYFNEEWSDFATALKIHLKHWESVIK